VSSDAELAGSHEEHGRREGVAVASAELVDDVDVEVAALDLHEQITDRP